MIRTIVKPNKSYIRLDIPKEYVGKEIEVTCFPLNEINKKDNRRNKTMKDFWGILSDETAAKSQEHVAQSREEWNRDI